MALRKPNRVYDRYLLEEMTPFDISEVVELDKRCFSNPWPASAYRKELRHPERAHYIVLRAMPAEPESADEVSRSDGKRTRRSILPFTLLGGGSHRPIVGFAGMWNFRSESHVTTIGIDPEHQGNGLGELLLCALIDEAIRRHTAEITLEVRVSNQTARQLYRKYDFAEIGIRLGYYTDNLEDALLMTSPPVYDTAYRLRLTELRDELRIRLEGFAEVPDLASLPAETSTC